MNPVDFTRTLAVAGLGHRSPQSAAALRAPESSTSLESKKLRKAAMDFESLLISSLWQSMQSDSLGASEKESDPGADTLKQLGVQAMASALAAAGGLGIGQLLLRQLAPAIDSKSSPGEAPQPLRSGFDSYVTSYKDRTYTELSGNLKNY